MHGVGFQFGHSPAELLLRIAVQRKGPLGGEMVRSSLGGHGHIQRPPTEAFDSPSLPRGNLA